jgi:hypothetical protein
MTQRVRELAERETALQLRCAAQRRAVGREVDDIETRLRTVDRIAGATSRAIRNPAVLALAGVGLFALGRVRALRLLGRAWLLVSAARRVLRASRALRSL